MCSINEIALIFPDSEKFMIAELLDQVGGNK